MIELRNVTKTFKSGNREVHAANDISFTVNDGEIFGLIGFSGAGKSTAVRCINLLERPDSGQVILDGVDLMTLKGRELRRQRRKIGMIFQQFNLFASRTVKENIIFPMKGRGYKKAEMEEKAKKLLELVELSDKADSYPSQLSGGQKQRVAIARALSTDPSILLCDEATSALDPQTTLSILELLKKLNSVLGITIVIITHEMHVVKEVCDRVAVMEDGKIVECGDVYDIFASPVADKTKSFIRTASNLTKIYKLIEENAAVTALKPGESLIKLTYTKHSAGTAVVSEVSRKFGIDFNIIYGSFELLGGENSPLGDLIVVISGSVENTEHALSYMKSMGIDSEVIRNG